MATTAEGWRDYFSGGERAVDIKFRTAEDFKAKGQRCAYAAKLRHAKGLRERLRYKNRSTDNILNGCAVDKLTIC